MPMQQGLKLQKHSLPSISYREIRYFLPGDHVALHVSRLPDRIRPVVPHPPVPPLLAKGPLCNVLPPLEGRRRCRGGAVPGVQTADGPFSKLGQDGRAMLRGGLGASGSVVPHAAPGSAFPGAGGVEGGVEGGGGGAHAGGEPGSGAHQAKGRGAEPKVGRLEDVDLNDEWIS